MDMVRREAAEFQRIGARSARCAFPAGASPASVSTGAPRSRPRACGGDPGDRESLILLIEFSGMSRREVERRLCERGCGTDIGRLRSGRLDLKMQHVLAICRVIDLDPLEFVQIVLKTWPAQSTPPETRSAVAYRKGRGRTARAAFQGGGSRKHAGPCPGSLGEAERSHGRLLGEGTVTGDFRPGLPRPRPAILGDL